MKKDVIYIDVDDDITTIAGKIKASSENIIGLVPPSRVGVLQSSVSMRLLQRTAEKAGKRIVLITNNQALISLAATAKIPVARNLQSKPEIPEVPVLKVDGDDVIDGGDLPVGDFAKTNKSNPGDEAVDKVIKAGSAATAAASGGSSARAAKKAKPTGGKKVPDFSSFRKKLFIIGGAALALVVFLVWAIWFAPRATVVISAKTTSVTVDETVNLQADAETDIEANIIKTLRQEREREASVEFTATGKKEMGERATGVVRFESDSASALLSGISIPSGTRLTSSSGAVYTTDSAVTLTISNRNGSTGITAVERGTNQNGARGTMSGAPRTVDARITTTTSGGTNREATVVSEEDVARATEELNQKQDESLKSALASAFGSSAIVIEESFSEDRSTPTPSVAVDSEASGTVTLKTTITASMLAIDQAEMEKYLKGRIEREIDGVENQRIYDNGMEDIRFAQFSDNDGPTVRLTANGTVGPTIEEDDVKEQARGKRYGDIQTSLESINGVDDVDTRFWPFWVRTIPNNDDRITVEFELQDAN